MGVGDGEAVGIGVGAVVGAGVAEACATAPWDAIGEAVGTAAASSSPPRAITNASDALVAMTSASTDPITAGLTERPARTGAAGASAMTTAPRR